MFHLDGGRLLMTLIATEEISLAWSERFRPTARPSLLIFSTPPNLPSSQVGHMQHVVLQPHRLRSSHRNLGVRDGGGQTDGWIVGPEAHRVMPLLRPCIVRNPRRCSGRSQRSLATSLGRAVWNP